MYSAQSQTIDVQIHQERMWRLLSHLTPAAVEATSQQLSIQQSSNGLDFELSPEHACGIVAYVGNGSAVPYILEGLRALENRGYDSAGICTIDDQHSLRLTKYASSQTTSDAIGRIQTEAPEKHGADRVGIGHTRWATHGGKTDANAHPHVDQTGRIAIVHNGVIENAEALKQDLKDNHSIQFQTETDSEVIAQLIGVLVGQGKDTVEAVKEAQTKMQGTWGLVVLDRLHPHRLIASKNGSPLLLGIGQGRMFIASEPLAFSQHTKEFIALEDGEMAVVEADRHNLNVKRVEEAVIDQSANKPDPFPNWTLREIFEQPEAIGRSLNYGGRLMGDAQVKLGGLDDNQHTLLNVHHLVIAGCGTSYYAALYGSQIMRYLRSFVTIQVIDAAEIGRETFPSEGAGLLVLSQSGETKDVHRAVVLAQELGIPTFSIVNVVRSLIARSTKCGVYLNAGRENAVASTKVFSCQVVVLALVAVWFAQKRDEISSPSPSSLSSGSRAIRRKEVVESLHRLSTSIGMAIYRLEPECEKVAQTLLSAEHCFVLGKGYSLAIALEGALKIKELSYLHVEGFGGGALKHGPISLLQDNFPVILIILDDVHQHTMETSLSEVKARGAHTIVITNMNKRFDCHQQIQIPSNGILTALLAVVPLQFIGYKLAVLKGLLPDRPRNLAKTVTTD